MSSKTPSKTEYIYGIHAVESILRNNPEQVLQVWFQSDRKDRRMQKLHDIAQSRGVSIELCSREALNHKSPDVHHQGVVAKVRMFEHRISELSDLIGRQQLLLLVLDGVQDPHNLGACLRSADAAGVDAVLVSKNRSSGLTPVVRKVASGAAETTPLIQVSNLAQALQKLRDDGVHIIGAGGEADSSIYDCEAADRLAIVMGAEGEGMRRLTRELCDEVVSIPMQGEVESLNVSVATGIFLFEFRRKQMQASARP
jgi:23S rRNA (guanosine2251-2'-O)-methyltransferase